MKRPPQVDIIAEPPAPIDPDSAANPSLAASLHHVEQNDDAGPQPVDAVTDCGVAPGHNRLEDREGA